MNLAEIDKQGNVWRKWDLHVHTPSTVFNNQYGGNTKNNWEKFVEDLENSDIEVIGATDYYSIDGYKKLKEYKNKGRLSNIKAIIPNIEFRLTTGATKNRFINYHVLFSPELKDEDIESEFLNKLTFVTNNYTYNCNEHDLNKLGAIFAGNTHSNNFYKIGCEQFKVDINQLNRILKKDTKFKDKYFTIVAGSSKDGITSLLTNLKQGSGVYSNILEQSDGIFDTNNRTINYFLGKGSDQEKEDLIDKLGGRKPCFEESDAHKFNDVFGKRWTWIKGEPSFNGLLQTKFEPERRVVISKKSEFAPNHHDSSKIISSITIDDEKNRFQKEIKFNPGLNTIIGGKSSGKSILLYEVAKNFFTDAQLREITDDNLNYDDLNLSSTVRLANGEYANREISIQYFPQLYINKISEKFNDQRLQKIIKDSLISKKFTFLPEVENFESEKASVNEKIRKEVKRYYSVLNSNLQLNERAKQIGNLNNLDKNIQVLNKRFEKLTADLKLSEEEVKQYNYNNKKIAELKNKINDDKKQILDVKLQIKEIKTFEDNVNNLFANLSQKNKKYLQKLVKYFLSEIKNKINTLVEKEKTLKQGVQILQSKIKNQENLLAPIIEKLNRKDELKTNRAKCDKYRSQCRELKNIQCSEKDNEDILKEIKNEIGSSIDKLIEKAKKIEKELNGKQITDDLKLKIVTTFNKNKYISIIDQYIDGRKQGHLESVGLKEPDHIDFNLNNFSKEWKDIINFGLDGKYNSLLRKNVTSEDFILQLSQLPVNLPININKESDDLDKMSPGKRALVVLELLLENNSNNNPILIDQPEDNLDNRSISRELVKLLRKVSRYRQVIIVTHNANLVVLSDADEVIVANQDQELKENLKYRFEYITGSLENSTGYSNDKTKLCSNGIKKDITDILEGGVSAFKTRERKYLI